MLSTGNGEMKVCVNNLLNVFRGEIPLERGMGIDRSYIGKPAGTNTAKFVIDTKQMLQTYEGRAVIDQLKLRQELTAQGKFDIEIEIKSAEE